MFLRSLCKDIIYTERACGFLKFHENQFAQVKKETALVLNGIPEASIFESVFYYVGTHLQSF